MMSSTAAIAVEDHAIVAGAALDQVAAVARVPGEQVGVDPAEHPIVARPSRQVVIALATEQRIDPALATQRVVAVATIDQVVRIAADQAVVTGATQNRGR